LVEISGGITVVMLCFENVLAGERCHRRYVAEFIEQNTGLVVPELEPGMIPERPNVAEPKLF
jgi:hypothetical protein